MKKEPKSLYYLLLAFFIVNILQSAFTSVSKDEAYYWMFSRHLDFGYFDHPPMVALLIWAGTCLFPGTLGIRLLTSLLSALTLFLTWKLLPAADRRKKNAVLVFALTALSMPIFNIYGFITTPDVPLLFFSALYFHVFLRFLEKKDAGNAVKLGIVAALLMFSKYHGALLILLSFLPHYRLLANRWFYLSVVTGLALYMPHLYWQYQHEFITFRYHLFERTNGFMGGKHVLTYVLNAFVILNPFMLGMLLYYRFIRHTGGALPSMYWYVFWGFLAFFGFNSLRYHIEPQWIGVAVIPLTLFLTHSFLESEARQTMLKKVAAVSITLLLALRIILVLPVDLKSEFHRQKAAYYGAIRQKAGGSKVVFINSYSDASRYTFYTGEPAFSYNSFDYRKNQYDIWDYEKTYHGANMYFTTRDEYPWTDSIIQIDKAPLFFVHIRNFPMLNKTTGKIASIGREAARRSIQTVRFTVRNPYDYPIVFNDTLNPVSFWLVYETGRRHFLARVGTGELPDLNPGEEMEVKGYYYPDLPAGEYHLAVGIQPGKMNPLLITGKERVFVR